MKHNKLPKVKAIEVNSDTLRNNLNLSEHFFKEIHNS